MRTIRNVIRCWLPLAFAVTVMSALVYAAVQQSLRLAADDPQVQMAEDAAAALAAGAPPGSVIPVGKVDLAGSVAPYLVVYDRDGKALASNGVLDGRLPQLPPGVFDAARRDGEDRITWQPQPAVRDATVTVPVSGGQGGYVTAGRSLREAEKRIELLGAQVGIAWFVAVLGTLVLVTLFDALPLKRSA